MTVCVSAFADKGQTLVLVADKMVGLETIQSELDITKILPLHRYWHVMIAGTVAPIFEILDAAKDKLGNRRMVSVNAVLNAIADAYQEVRLRHVELAIVKQSGFTLEYLRKFGGTKIGERTFREIINQVQEFSFELDLLVAGFDSNGRGHLFKFDSTAYDPIIRLDIPGFGAIGTGSDEAIHMLHKRKLSINMPLRLVLYYALEAKYFGELAPGVGERTDLYILRYGKRPIQVSENILEKHLFPMCNQLSYRELTNAHLKTLNTLPGLHRKEFEALPLKRRRRRKKAQKP